MIFTLHTFRNVIFIVAFLFWACSSRAQDSFSDSVWRCSLDKKAYTIQASDGFLHIIPVRAGIISANLSIKADKKGRQSVMGQWQSGLLSGFIAITGISDQGVSGYMLVPQKGAAPNGCVTRVAAILTTLAGANGNQAGCVNVAITWSRESNLTIAQAAAEEIQVNTFAASAENAEVANTSQVANPLVGTWVFEDAGSVHYTRIELTLRADGTYTKTLGARTPGWGGGGVVGAGSLGGTHSGTWTARGSVVHLSGDGNWPPYDHDLSGFRKVR